MSNLNPFICGKPIPTEYFIGRRDILQHLFSRLSNGESSALTGEPHIGKSSILQFVANAKKRQAWLRDSARKMTFIYFDCHLLTIQDSPSYFWKFVIMEAFNADPNQILANFVANLQLVQYNPITLSIFFKQLAQDRRQVVLLLDEFDTLLSRPNFNTTDFFGALRSCSSNTDGLVLVTASRLPISKLNIHLKQLEYGSPFLNTNMELTLLPFSRHECQELLEQGLLRAAGLVNFTDDDYEFLIHLAGKHPYLLQLAAQTLYNVKLHSKDNENEQQTVMNHFRDRAADHFMDFWRRLEPEEQRALLLLGLSQYRGFVDGHNFNPKAFGRTSFFDTDLGKLEKRGLGESSPIGNHAYLRFLNTYWRITVGGLVPWLMENIVPKIRDLSSSGYPIHDKDFQFLELMTHDEIKRMIDVASAFPQKRINASWQFIKSLVLSK